MCAGRRPLRLPHCACLPEASRSPRASALETRSPALTPLSSPRHDHKERLRAWYVARLGYDLQVPGDYMASTTRLPRGTLLLGRFELAVESDFTVYRRSI